jgi:hypothetical protein
MVWHGLAMPMARLAWPTFVLKLNAVSRSQFTTTKQNKDDEHRELLSYHAVAANTGGEKKKKPCRCG